MAILCGDLNLLYVCADKTGSTSVSALLLDELGGRWLPPDHLWSDGELIVDFKHSSIADLVEYGLLSSAEISSMEVAITVRNPYSWVLSGYRYRRRVLAQRERLAGAAPGWMIQRGRDLEDAAMFDFDGYVEHRFAGAAHSVVERYLDGYTDLPRLTFLRIENIDQELNELLGRLGVGWHVAIERTNQTEGNDHRTVYSERSRSIITSAFAGDLSRFGYEF